MKSSKWTINALRKHLIWIIQEKERRQDQAIGYQDRAVSAALASADQALSKAEAASEKRFDAVNEFRETLADQARLLMPRLEVEQTLASMERRLGIVEKLQSETSGAKQQSMQTNSGLMWFAGFLVSTAVAIAAIAFAALKG